tara:strand:+ start:146 stop:346 length:201 start_codon:yes stop_codon:yes gene_type:complete
MDQPLHIGFLGLVPMMEVSASLFERAPFLRRDDVHQTETIPVLAGRDDVQRFERQGYAARRFNLRV